MDVFLTILHVLAALFLIGVVLLQHGKGADIGAAFGAGGSNTVFGGRGAGSFLTRLTTAFVVIFMATRMSLTYFSRPRSVTDIIGDQPPQESIGEVPELPESSFPEAVPLGEPTDPGDAPSGFEAIPAPSGDSTGAGDPDEDEDSQEDEAPLD